MKLTAADVEGVPATNLHIPVGDFVAVWAAAEAAHEDRVRRHVPDWYGTGVIVTCRWLAQATVRPETGRWYPADSPITERSNMAYEELIEAEARAAEVLEMRQPRPRWLQARPGWVEGVVATFAWAWRRTAPPPIHVSEHTAPT